MGATARTAALVDSRANVEPLREEGGVLPDERGVPETEKMGEAAALVVIVGVVGGDKRLEAIEGNW